MENILIWRKIFGKVERCIMDKAAGIEHTIGGVLMIIFVKFQCNHSIGNWFPSVLNDLVYFRI